MDKITQVREAHAKFDVTVSDSMPEIFTDGVSNMVMGNPVSKLTFHSVTVPVHGSNDVEQRKGVVRLVIPTPVLLEMCRNVLFAAQSSIDSYSEGGKQLDAKLKSIMSGVSIPSATTGLSKSEGKK